MLENSCSVDANPTAQQIAPSNLDTSRKFAMACHLLPLVSAIIPFSTAVAPFFIWYTHKDKDPFVAAHARASLNFHCVITALNLSVAALSGLVLIMPSAFAMFSIFAFMGSFILFPFIAVAVIVTVTLATIRAYEGKLFQYPISFDIAGLLERTLFNKQSDTDIPK